MKTLFHLRPSRIAGTLAAIAAVTATLLGLATAPASASSGFTVTIQPASNPFLNLDAQGGGVGDGTRIIQWTVNAGPNQVWTFAPVNGGFEIVGRQSGKCITTDGVAGHAVYLWACEQTPGQIWSTGLEPNSASQWAIQSVLSNLYLEVYGGSGSRGTAIDTWWWNGGQHQYFGASYSA